MKLSKFPVFFSLAGTLVPLHAADISSWRNDGNGLYPGTKAATDWTQASQIVWETPLPAASNGSPILVAGKLFFTAEPATLACADAKTGKILWQKSNEYADFIEMTPEKKAEMEA